MCHKNKTVCDMMQAIHRSSIGTLKSARMSGYLLRSRSPHARDNVTIMRSWAETALPAGPRKTMESSYVGPPDDLSHPQVPRESAHLNRSSHFSLFPAWNNA